MKYPVQQCTELLFEFEQQHAIEAAEFGGIGIWPLLRLQFYLAQQGNLDPGEGPEPSRREGKVPARKIANLIDEWLDEAVPGIDSRTVVYFVQSTKMCEDSEGVPYHRFFDSLIDLTGTRESSRFLHWDDYGKSYETASLRSPGSSFNELRKLAARWRRSDDPEIDSLQLSEGTRGLVDAWNARPDTAKVSLEAVARESLLVYKLAEVLARFLAARPAAVFANCFYTVPVLALSFACRKNNVPLVELQHGQQGDWHSFYTHWTENGLSDPSLLPTHFWMWGSDYADRVRKWWPEPGFEIVCGGNPWLLKRSEEKAVRHISRKPGKRKVILISMQLMEISEFVWECARERSDCTWWFRMHPRLLDSIDIFSEECRLRLGDSVEWEVTAPSSGDFYDLLDTVDIHLTGWSTTAYEAVYFGVPTILTHPNGKAAMAEDIERGLFRYVESAEELSAALDDVTSPRGASSKFAMSRESAIAAFERLVVTRPALCENS